MVGPAVEVAPVLVLKWRLRPMATEETVLLASSKSS